MIDFRALKTGFRTSIFAWIVLFSLFLTSAVSANDAPRTVVLGEVQGAFNTTTSLLQKLDLIDQNLHWSGGETVLVQTGDLVDGGEGVRATLDLFMRLQTEAEAAGGRVVVLMGNHEIMNIMREFKSVNYMAYATFAGPDAEQRQKELYAEYVAWRQRRAKETGTGAFAPSEDFKADYFATHPPGWAEYAEMMAPSGIYGRWMRALPVAYRAGDVLFIHAGIGPEMKGVDVDSMNQRAAAEIAAFDKDTALMVSEGLCLTTHSVRDMAKVVQGEIEYVNSLNDKRRNRGNQRVARLMEIQELTRVASWSVLDDDGPLWFKGPSEWSESEKGPEMESILDAGGIERMVTGQSNGGEMRIKTRFDDRVVLTSVNLADGAYSGGGKPAALEIDDGVYSVVTSDSRDVLLKSKEGG